MLSHTCTMWHNPFSSADTPNFPQCRSKNFSAYPKVNIGWWKTKRSKMKMKIG
jgi:hypothetical protein